jgi:hypothetical protein
MNMCASFYWEYVIMYLVCSKELNENIIFYLVMIEVRVFSFDFYCG